MKTNIIINDDCLNFMKSLPDKCIDLCLTDLPYGMTQNIWDKVIDFDNMWFELKRIMKPISTIALFGMQPFTSKVIMSNIDMFKYLWTWKKSQSTGFLNAWKMPMRSTEDIAIFYNKNKYFPILTNKPIENRRTISKSGKKSSCYGDYKNSDRKCPPDKSLPNTIIEFNNAQGTIHPTEKPIDLISYFIETYTEENDIVIDLCAGSGVTAISCINMNRKYILVEKEKEYFDIINKRIERHLDGNLFAMEI